MPTGEQVPPGKLALLAVTFGRPMAIQRLVRSVRGRYPNVGIYVADQSDPDPFMDEFYRDHDVTVVRTGYDSGVSFSRNRLLEEIDEDYVLVSDDDVVVVPETSFEIPLAILDERSDIGVVGGRLWNVVLEDGVPDRDNMFWELLFLEDSHTGTLTTAPIHLFPRPPLHAAGERIFLTDSVLNFSIIRRSAFNETIRWDPQFKSNGEHEDFYLNWKRHGTLKVVYAPAFVAEHHRPGRAAYEQSRQRRLGWDMFMRKWSLEHHMELGYGVRPAYDTASFATMESLGVEESNLGAMKEARVAYYFGGDGDPSARPGVMRSEPAPAPVDETPAEEISLFGAHLREHLTGSDFTLFLRPESPLRNKGESMSRTVLYSWRVGETYLVYNAQLELHEAPPVWSEWTAFDVPVPDIEGVLTLEVLVPGETTGSLAGLRATVVSSSRPRLALSDEWVFAFTPSRRTAPGADTMVPARWRRELADAIGGVNVEMLSLVDGDAALGDTALCQVPPHSNGPVRVLASGFDALSHPMAS